MTQSASSVRPIDPAYAASVERMLYGPGGRPRWNPSQGYGGLDTRGKWQQAAADIGTGSPDYKALVRYGENQGWVHRGSLGDAVKQIAPVALAALGGYGLYSAGLAGAGAGISGGAGSSTAFGGAGAAAPGAGAFFGAPVAAASTPTLASMFGGAATAAPAASWMSTYGVPAAILGSSGLGYLASQNAADVQSDAANQAAQASQAQYNQTRADLAPWRQAGVSALAKLQSGNFEADPGYQFRLSEGEKAINRAAAARGSWDSGATGKALTRYAQDYATGEYGNVYNRLANLAGLGQTATSNTGQFGSQATSDINNYLTSGAAARGAGAVGGANAITGGVGSLVNFYNQQALLKALGGA